MVWENLATARKAILVAMVGFAFGTAVPPLRLSRLQAGETQQTGRSDTEDDEQAATSFFQRYCFDCHAADAPEAGIRLDSVDLSFDAARDHDVLQSVATVVGRGEMPPEEAEGPTADERQRLASWLERRLGEVAEQQRRTGRWTRNRRLTVDEYNYTMQSLFGVDAQFADRLPPDPISPEGFQNDSDLLGLGSLQIECYLDSARQAVQRYVRFGEPDERPVRYHVEFEDLDYSAADRYGTRKRAPQPVDADAFDARRSANANAPPQYIGPLTGIPPGPFPTDEELRAAIPKLHQQFLAIPECTSIGEMIVRIRAAATPDRNGRFPRMRLESGITLGDGCSMDTRLLGEVDVTAPLDDPAVYEFRTRVEDVPTKGPLSDENAYDQLSVFDMVQVFIANVSRDERAIYDLGRGEYRDPDAVAERVDVPLEKMADAGVSALYLDCIEIEMLPSRTRDSGYPWTIDAALAEQGKQEQRAVAEELLTRFTHRAFRRPPSAAEIANKMELFDALRTSNYTFEESVRETFTAVLVSPSFLFLEGIPPLGDSQKSEPTAHQLASRLSYLLWLAPPDERLTKLADDGSLADRQVLRTEAERLMDDPRSRRFLDSFCRQWLRLDKFRNVSVDSEIYPDYDVDLAEAMVQETLHYFAEIFQSNANALELIDSDYAFLNDRLAAHYGLAPVAAGDFQKVSLPEGSVRGGLLTQASIMAMNSDGVDSHPIRRGVWLLDRLLNSPPPPPPPNVPDIDQQDADFRGLSLKERIELHRQPGACQSCHKKIDPWGIALENFDAVGRWRDTIRSDGRGDGPSTPVDAAVLIPGGEPIDGVLDLKRYLHEERSEQFTKALTSRMLTYALGRSLDYADRQQVDAIHKRFTAADYQLRELVLAIVDCEAFRQ